MAARFHRKVTTLVPLLAGGMEIGRLKADDRVYVITDQQVIEV
jgi:hypothetical protein